MCVKLASATRNHFIYRPPATLSLSGLILLSLELLFGITIRYKSGRVMGGRDAMPERQLFQLVPGATSASEAPSTTPPKNQRTAPRTRDEVEPEIGQNLHFEEPTNGRI
ncbi:hypothetical protein DFH09DRAFT_1273084 [Mycena vulgaris]|nr:hypothetical protein DFH09DRAFT_1273084 [Mycena vulgaris]